MGSVAELCLRRSLDYGWRRRMFSQSEEQRIESIKTQLQSLQDERRKIEAFKRELPICMQLLTDAIETSNEELLEWSSGSLGAENYKDGVSDDDDRHSPAVPDDSNNDGRPFPAASATAAKHEMLACRTTSNRGATGAATAAMIVKNSKSKPQPFYLEQMPDVICRNSKSSTKRPAAVHVDPMQVQEEELEEEEGTMNRCMSRISGTTTTRRSAAAAAEQPSLHMKSTFWTAAEAFAKGEEMLSTILTTAASKRRKHSHDDAVFAIGSCSNPHNNNIHDIDVTVELRSSSWRPRGGGAFSPFPSSSKQLCSSSSNGTGSTPDSNSPPQLYSVDKRTPVHMNIYIPTDALHPPNDSNYPPAPPSSSVISSSMHDDDDDDQEINTDDGHRRPYVNGTTAAEDVAPTSQTSSDHEGLVDVVEHWVDDDDDELIAAATGCAYGGGEARDRLPFTGRGIHANLHGLMSQAPTTTTTTVPLTSMSSFRRKQRRCWSPELHRKFLSALHQLGGSEAATPKLIRELMRVDGLTNDEVKSHLQKYRLHMRRPGGAVDATVVSTSEVAERRRRVGPRQLQAVNAVLDGVSAPRADAAAAESQCNFVDDSRTTSSQLLLLPPDDIDCERIINIEQQYLSSTCPTPVEVAAAYNRSELEVEQQGEMWRHLHGAEEQEVSDRWKRRMCVNGLEERSRHMHHALFNTRHISI